MAKVSCAERIRQGMQLRGLKQADICAMTDIDKSTMSQYVSGKYEPSQVRIELIARALDVNDAWLTGYDVPMEREIIGTYNNQPPNWNNEAPPLNLSEDASEKYYELMKIIDELSDEQWDKLIDYAMLLLGAQPGHKDD